MRLVIKCAVCDKLVDRWSVFPERMRQGITVTAECHGQKQTAFYSDAVLYQIYRQYGEDATINGVAFEQKGIANE